MPRPNAPRRVYSEQTLAERIKHERAARGWTLENVAERMRDRGCPINNSAIYKIEKWDPPRRITVDELVAFASVFETTVEQLLVPVELISHERFGQLVREAEEQIMLSLALDTQRDAAIRAVEAYAEDHPEMLAKFRNSKVLKDYFDHIDRLRRTTELAAAGLGIYRESWESRADLVERALAGGVDPATLPARMARVPEDRERERASHPLVSLARIIAESKGQELVERLGAWVDGQRSGPAEEDRDG